MGIIERVVSAVRWGSVIPFLVAVSLDDHLAIRFPVALPDDRCFAWLALAFLDHGRSFAISVAMIRAYRHSGSDRADLPRSPVLRRICLPLQLLPIRTS
jgi:hypothetical protein